MKISLYATKYVRNTQIMFPELKEFDHIYKTQVFHRYNVKSIQIDEERDIITEVKLVDMNDKTETVKITYTDMPLGDTMTHVDISIQTYVSDNLVYKTIIMFIKNNDVGKITSLHYSSESFNDAYNIRDYSLSVDRFNYINGKKKLPEKITKIADIVKPDDEETLTFTTINEDFSITTSDRDFSKVIRFSVEGEEDYYETVRTKTITEIELTEDDIKNDIVKKEREVSDMLGYRKLDIETSYFKNGHKKEVQTSENRIRTTLFDESNRVMKATIYCPHYDYLSINDPKNDGKCEFTQLMEYKYGSFEGLDIVAINETKTYIRNGEVIEKQQDMTYRITLEKKDSAFPAMFEYV